MTVLIQQFEAIGTIIPDIVVEEVGTDLVMVTENPVEVGAPVQDHAYKRPAEILMRCGWSDSSHQQQGFIVQVYQKLLALQIAFKPFDVYTMKRKYTSMLIHSLVLTTDQKTKNILQIICGLRQVIITSTAGFSSAGAPASMAAPAESGQQSPVSEGIGPNSSEQFAQLGGISNNTVPALGTIPGNGFAGSI